ncbi:contact-dependent growth inhibition system immunity protein [Nocardioides pyridinolyticus]
MTRKPALATLVGAYLNQDVYDFYPDEMAAVDDFVKLDPQGANELPGEIDEVLETRSDTQIDALLISYGIGFVPGELGYRGWLAKIADRVRASSPTRPAAPEAGRGPARA